MKLSMITSEFGVSPQIAQADLKAIAAQGFATVICNRPDGEADGQPASAELQNQAAELGLTYVHVPVKPDAIEDGHVDAFRAALSEADGPVFAFCGTGKRAVMMWALAQRGEHSADDILEICSDSGFDVEGLRPRLAS